MKKGKRLEKLIEDSPYKNINRFAKAAKVPYTTLKSFIDRDLERAGVDNVSKIAKTLNVTVDYLISENQENNLKGSNNLNFIKNKPSYEYNFYPTEISAGNAFNVEGITSAEKIALPDEMMGKWARNKNVFVTKVNGDSMNKIIPDNSFVIIEPLDEISTRFYLKDGDIVIYSVDHDYAIKRFLRSDDKIIFRPESYDPRFYDYVTDQSNERLKIHGKVVSYTVNLT